MDVVDEFDAMLRFENMKLVSPSVVGWIKCWGRDDAIIPD